MSPVRLPCSWGATAQQLWACCSYAWLCCCAWEVTFSYSETLIGPHAGYRQRLVVYLRDLGPLAIRCLSTRCSAPRVYKPCWGKVEYSRSLEICSTACKRQSAKTRPFRGWKQVGRNNFILTMAINTPSTNWEKHFCLVFNRSGATVLKVGGQILRAKQAEKFLLTPHFLGSGGQNIA